MSITVKELIALLKRHDPNMPVSIAISVVDDEDEQSTDVFDVTGVNEFENDDGEEMVAIECDMTESDADEDEDDEDDEDSDEESDDDDDDSDDEEDEDEDDDSDDEEDEDEEEEEEKPAKSKKTKKTRR